MPVCFMPAKSQLNRTTNVPGVESQLNCTANVSNIVMKPDPPKNGIVGCVSSLGTYAVIAQSSSWSCWLTDRN